MKVFIELFTEEEVINQKDVVDLKGKFFLSKEKEFPCKPFAAGLYLGEKVRRFMPSPALLEMIQPHTDKTVTVTDKAAWLFICGRDVLLEGVVKGKKKGTVLILNRRGECLGFGAWKKDAIQNRMDIGYFLRRER